MLKAKYNEDGRCPLCGSYDVDWEDVRHNDDYIEHKVRCEKCNARWTQFDKIVFECVENIQKD